MQLSSEPILALWFMAVCMTRATYKWTLLWPRILAATGLFEIVSVIGNRAEHQIPWTAPSDGVAGKETCGTFRKQFLGALGPAFVPTNRSFVRKGASEFASASYHLKKTNPQCVNSFKYPKNPATKANAVFLHLITFRGRYPQDSCKWVGIGVRLKILTSLDAKKGANGICFLFLLILNDRFHHTSEMKILFQSYVISGFLDSR